MRPGDTYLYVVSHCYKKPVLERIVTHAQLTYYLAEGRIFLVDTSSLFLDLNGSLYAKPDTFGPTVLQVLNVLLLPCS